MPATGVTALRNGSPDWAMSVIDVPAGTAIVASVCHTTPSPAWFRWSTGTMIVLTISRHPVSYDMGWENVTVVAVSVLPPLVNVAWLVVDAASRSR